MPKTLTRTRRSMAAAALAAGARHTARPPRRELRFRSAPHGHRAGGVGETPNTRYRILVVDDESAIRTLVRVNLRIAGMEVAEAAEGESAVRAALETHPDLILLDVMLPGETGWDVASKLAQHPETREIPVVFLTAMADDTDLIRGQEQGAVGYITKPFDPVSLSATVERTLERLARGERHQLQAEITGSQ